MTQPAKNQEPSMDEILASIRRIIADDPAKTPRPEVARKELLHSGNSPAGECFERGGAAPATRRDHLLGPLSPRDEPSTAPPPVSSAHAGERKGEPRPALFPEANLRASRGAASLSRAEGPSAVPVEEVSAQQEIDAMLAELNFRTRAVAVEEPEQPAGDVFELTDELAPEPPAADDPAQAQFADDAAEASAVAALAASAHGPEDRHEEVETEEAPPDEMQLEPQPAESFTEHLHELHDPKAGSGRDDGGLISAATSAAVDSAFNTLAQTVLVQNARTLEDLVREMLRPMLKIWLDDNLPGLVERLVRAEIERVSRGRG